ncbi:MAG: thiaminase II [Bacillati bacterium ANGP1]|uniref:Aminopyrimidine aminohydrolase n=1 Tax=Candidatus Segetimicrobium genomatis TaxID=2569760 RepID=A0A537JDQ3_9BACT|nr:MAG: thiaminase II [Terrabacteria group bacterium ANGP1]
MARRMSLFARLQAAAAPLRERIHAHPFVRGLGSGDLAEDRFQFYLRQDYLFLIEYCRVLALASARAEDLAVAARFAGLLTQTLNVEMDLHRRFARKAGIAPEVLEATRPAPATVAYTNHLRLAAETGDLSTILAAILPCAHGYWEIASALRAEQGWDRHPRYAEWIRMYTSEEYEAFARWAADLLDRIAEALPAGREAALGEVYLRSQRYEYLFWEMAHRMEEWPV